MTDRADRAQWLRLERLCIILLFASLLAGCDREKAPAERSSQKIEARVGAPGSADSTGPIAIRDAQNEEVRLPAPARRVISLAPSMTEIIYGIGGESALIGRTAYCDFPPEATKLPVMGDMLTLNYETIIASQPDLILMTHVGNIKGNYYKLRDLKLTTCVLHDATVEKVIGTIDTVGLLLGRRSEAKELGRGLLKTIDSIRALASERPKVSLFIVIDKAPLMTASRGFLAEQLEIAGGDNIGKGGITEYPKYSREELLRRDPEVIIIPGTSWDVVDEMLALYPEWKRLRAVRTNRVYVINHNVIHRPGPRMGRSITLLYKALHGADPREVLEESLR